MFEFLREAGLTARAGWDYVEPERQAAAAMATQAAARASQEARRAYQKTNTILRLLVIVATGWPTLLIAVAAIGTWKLHFGGGGLMFAFAIGIPAVAFFLFGLVYARTMGRRSAPAIVIAMFGGAGILFAVLAVGLTPYREVTLDGETAVMFLAVVPFIALVGVLIWSPLKIIGAYAAGSAVIGAANWATTKSPLKKAYIPSAGTMVWWILSGFAIDCLVGAYLLMVTISSNRRLILPLVVITLTLILLRSINRWKGIRILLTMAFWVITVIFCLGEQTDKASELGKHLSGLLPTSAPAPANYRREQILCDDGDALVESDHDLSRDPSAVAFSQKLREGCWDGFTRVPNWWPDWTWQLKGTDTTGWVAILYKGASEPDGPFTWTSRPEPAAARPRAFQLQGKGEILFHCRGNCRIP